MDGDQWQHEGQTSGSAWPVHIFPKYASWMSTWEACCSAVPLSGRNDRIEVYSTLSHQEVVQEREQMITFRFGRFTVSGCEHPSTTDYYAEKKIRRQKYRCVMQGRCSAWSANVAFLGLLFQEGCLQTVLHSELGMWVGLTILW